MDYQKALALVKTARNKYKKPIVHNTWLILDTNSNDVAVHLHQTDIITFKPDGAIILDTGGWESKLTKDRMNEYLDHHRVGSERGVWTISSGGIDYFFENDMVINPDGTIDAQPIFAKKLEKLTGKSINTYDGLIKAIEGLSIEELVKAWKRFKRDRTLIAKYCRADFLPLTIGTQSDDWKDDPWRQVVSERLRTA
jgi:hypothetical protein